MKIKDFIEEYKNSQEKDICVKSHIIEKYIPYEKKMAICKNIIESADYVPSLESADKKCYLPNTPLRQVLFKICLIDIYTDIKLKKVKENRDVMGGYNLLDSNGVFEVLIKELNREYNILNNVLDMMVNDTKDKENNFINFVNNKIDSLKFLYDTALPIIEQKIDNFSVEKDL